MPNATLWVFHIAFVARNEVTMKIRFLFFYKNKYITLLLNRSLILRCNMKLDYLFNKLYFSKNETDIDKVLIQYKSIFNSPKNWRPLNGNENNFGVIENQQASPIAALIEKITNSIDATLMKKAYQAGINPKSPNSPRTMADAVRQFFPNSKNWDLGKERMEQSKDLQIVADGYYKDRNKDTSLTIYDNGEGQHPKDFESTFLSLLRGNKNEIAFVQGKYNMGGTGAIVFCGKKRYQLIASKKYTNDGNFGFTLVRKHPMTTLEKQTKKNTWYEYFVFNDEIPNFPIDELELDLYERKFKTGSLIKLYSYQLPKGSSSVISKDLNQSINEYLFEPALPILMVDKEERYPKDINLQRDLYGLKRRLERSTDKYIDTYFSITDNTKDIGEMKVTTYVFKPKLEGKTVTESRKTIQNEFFKNNMAVVFSMNGQVHGFYTSEFISRGLKMSLLKNHLLIHVDCTKMDFDFRNQLFMASRDRLKKGEESAKLRDHLKSLLQKSKLKDINKQRKQGLTLDSNNSGDLLKSFTKNLPQNSDLFSLLGKTFDLEANAPQKPKAKSNSSKNKKGNKNEEVFDPKRYPSSFRLNTKGKKDNDGITVIKIPKGSDKTLKFSSDVEDHYFDRVEDPGDMSIGLVNQDYEENETKGGNAAGGKTKIEDVINVTKSSPNKGAIKIVMNPNEDIEVGEKIKVKVSLKSPTNESFDEIFWIQITEKQPEPKKKKEDDKPEKLGLPDYKLVYQEEKEGFLSWEKLEASSIEMDYNTVMHPSVGEEDKLECIFINMDSNVLKTFKTKSKNPSTESLELADKRYVTSVYFHTLFLYTITQKRKYKISRIEDETEKSMDIPEYLKDLFMSYYSEFLLNFGIEELMNSLED